MLISRAAVSGRTDHTERRLAGVILKCVLGTWSLSLTLSTAPNNVCTYIFKKKLSFRESISRKLYTCSVAWLSEQFKCYYMHIEIGQKSLPDTIYPRLRCWPTNDDPTTCESASLDMLCILNSLIASHGAPQICGPFCHG